MIEERILDKLEKYMISLLRFFLLVIVIGITYGGIRVMQVFDTGWVWVLALPITIIFGVWAVAIILSCVGEWLAYKALKYNAENLYGKSSKKSSKDDTE